VKAVNLIPADQRGGAGPAAGRSQGGAYAVPVLLAGLAILTLFYGTARHEISARRAQSVALAAQTAQAQARATELTPYTTFVKLQEERVQAVTSLAASRFDWSYAFHELGRVLPRSASISSFSGTVGAPSSTSSASSSATTAQASTVTSATPPGSVPVFVIGGCAISQSEVAQTIARLRLIDGVSEVTLQSSVKAASSGGSSGGGCQPSDPVFAITITFNPLPAAPSGGGSSATAATAANTSTGAAG
jgi:Tfp pilus assembly protein PilN